MSPGSWHHPAGREVVDLGAGLRLALRPVGPGDRHGLEAAFQQLSPASRYARFLGHKTALTDGELRFLSTPDGRHHVAVAALRLDEDGKEAGGVAVARLVRLQDQPWVAEIAVTVVDAWQGRGIGGLLMERLVETAAHGGIRRLRCTVLAENTPMRRLCAAHGKPVLVRRDGEVLTLELAVAPPATGKLCRRLRALAAWLRRSGGP